jgi:hypothetical protein
MLTLADYSYLFGSLYLITFTLKKMLFRSVALKIASKPSLLASSSSIRYFSTETQTVPATTYENIIVERKDGNVA